MKLRDTERLEELLILEISQNPKYGLATKVFNDFLDMIHALPVVDPKQEWISVKDRLPTEEDANKNESVLAIAKKDGFGRSWCWDIVRDYSSEFSHWMSFPEPPKDGE